MHKTSDDKVAQTLSSNEITIFWSHSTSRDESEKGLKSISVKKHLRLVLLSSLDFEPLDHAATYSVDD